MIELLEHDENIRELRLNRPPVNALDAALLRTLIGHLETAQSERDAIVVSGAPGIFSAGLDVPGMLKLNREAIGQVFAELWSAQRAIAYCEVPVLFGITGHCPAGGTVLAIHADYRVMAKGNFRLGLNEVQVGLVPVSVIAAAFTRLVGGHAAQLLTRGALIDPEQALRMGLVDELAAPPDVIERTLSLAREWVRLPREPMRQTRDLTRRSLRELFGDPGHSVAAQREFCNLAVEMWFSPATQATLAKLFVKQTTG